MEHTEKIHVTPLTAEQFLHCASSGTATSLEDVWAATDIDPKFEKVPAAHNTRELVSVASSPVALSDGPPGHSLPATAVTQAIRWFSINTETFVRCNLRERLAKCTDLANRQHTKSCGEWSSALGDMLCTLLPPLRSTFPQCIRAAHRCLPDREWLGCAWCRPASGCC